MTGLLAVLTHQPEMGVHQSDAGAKGQTAPGSRAARKLERRSASGDSENTRRTVAAAPTDMEKKD